MATGIDKKALVALAAAGCKNGEMAAEFGVSAGAITQALGQEAVQAQVAEAASKLANGEELDLAYDTLEMKLLKRLDTATTFLSDPMKLQAVLRTVNAAKRRAGIGQQAASAPSIHQAVTLALPGSFQTKVLLNEQREVVEVAGRTLVTMPSANVAEMLVTKQKEEHALALEQDAPMKLGDIL